MNHKCPLPSFTLQLRDTFGKATTAPDGVNVMMVTKAKKISIRHKRLPPPATTFQGHIDNENGLTFGGGDWVLETLNPKRPLIGKNTVGSYVEDVEVHVAVVEGEHVTTPLQPVMMKIKVVPGPVCEVETSEPLPDEQGKIEVEDGDMFPPLVVKTYDYNGNLTAPRPTEVWSVYLNESLTESALQYADNTSSTSRRGGPLHEINSQGYCRMTGLKVGGTVRPFSPRAGLLLLLRVLAIIVFQHSRAANNQSFVSLPHPPETGQGSQPQLES